jgi:class 3 adenylate cyclase
VRIAAELRRVEELVERVNRLRRRVGQRLAQAAVRIGIARRQAAVREDNQDSKDFPLRKCLMVPIANGADCRSLIGLG